MEEDLEHAGDMGETSVDPDPATEEALPEIAVTIRGGKAILIGIVRSSEERRAAEPAAWAFPAVREIDDRLVVVSSEEP